MASTQRSNIEVIFKALGADQVRRAFQGLSTAGLNLSRTFSSFSFGAINALGNVSAKALSLSKTFAAVGAVGLAGLAKGIKEVSDSSAELTSNVLALRAINGEVGKASGLPLFKSDRDGNLIDVNAGGATKTADDFRFIQQAADDSGKSIKGLASQYVQLNASATKVGVPLQDVRDLFTGINNASLTLGVNEEQTARAFTALTQMASKGVVSMEELRGQLSEALPGAIPLAAEAYGLSVKQFTEAVGKGQVDSATFIKKIGKALNDEYAGAAVKASNTTRVALGRLSNAFFLAKVSIGNGALDAQFRSLVNSATKLLKTLNANGAFTRFGKNLADAIKPLADRFEAAVNGGYDFEKILNAIAAGARVLVDGLIGIGAASVRVLDSLRNMKVVFDSYGLQLPSISEVLAGITDNFVKFSEALVTRQFSGNGFVDFFVSLYALIETCLFAVARLVSPKVGPGLRSMEDVFASVAYWLNQAAAAINTLSTGIVSPNLDETGVGILTNIIYAITKVRELIDQIKTAWALLSGKGAPEGADVGTQKLFASRDALGDLVSGKENKARFNQDGEQIYDPSQFNTLFQARDIVEKIITKIYENRAAFGAIFDGAADAIKGIVSALDLLSSTLDPIAKTLGFENINVAIGYAFGLYLIFSRIKIVAVALRSIFIGLTTSITAMATAVGLSVPQFLIIGAIIGLLVFATAKIVSNWQLLKDEIGNVITLIGAGLTAALAKAIRGLAGLLSYIPVVGSSIESSLNGFADKLDEGVAAAQQNVYFTSLERTSQRQVDNGGKDPFSDAGSNGKDAFGFLSESGLSKIFGDFGSKQEETNVQLKKIADQAAAAANDNAALSDPRVQEAAANIANNNGTGEFSKPVVIYLSDGTQVELRGREADAASFESLAAKTARNRPTNAPGWAG